MPAVKQAGSSSVRPTAVEDLRAICVQIGVRSTAPVTRVECAPFPKYACKQTRRDWSEGPPILPTGASGSGQSAAGTQAPSRAHMRDAASQSAARPAPVCRTDEGPRTRINTECSPTAVCHRRCWPACHPC
jgi:hypothetical protein